MSRKYLKRKVFGNGRNAYDLVREELKVLERIEHPNVIWLLEVIDNPDRDPIYLVTEYYSKGSLGDQVLALNEPNE